MKQSPARNADTLRVGGDQNRQPPTYVRVTALLRDAIANGLIPPGAILLEGHVAEILSVTRTPVRQALRGLEPEGVVTRFDGRGFLAGPAGAEPRRVTLTADMLGLDNVTVSVRKPPGWETIYDKVERDVVHLSVFDQYRINELELARHFGVGRIVARDVLLRLESLGLVEKDERSRWMVTPLDQHRISHLYELRWLLEPAALRAAMNVAQPAATAAMMTDLQRAIRAYPKVARSELDRLESDLHITYLSQCPNQALLQSLQRTRCLLTLSKHVMGSTAPMPKNDPFMSEHLAILQAAFEGNTAQAESALRQHLEDSCVKVTQRVELVRNNIATPHVPYIG